MPGDRFHYINGTIFCEHDRPGAALLSSHLPPIQSNSVLTDQKVNEKKFWWEPQMTSLNVFHVEQIHQFSYDKNANNQKCLLLSVGKCDG